MRRPPAPAVLLVSLLPRLYASSMKRGRCRLLRSSPGTPCRPRDGDGCRAVLPAERALADLYDDVDETEERTDDDSYPSRSPCIISRRAAITTHMVSSRASSRSGGIWCSMSAGALPSLLPRGKSSASTISASISINVRSDSSKTCCGLSSSKDRCGSLNAGWGGWLAACGCAAVGFCNALIGLPDADEGRERWGPFCGACFAAV